VAHPDGSATPDETAPIAVGVKLSPVDEIGEWLADASAFEAAGARALWIEVADDSDLDPVVLASALTVVTVRPLLIVTSPGSAESRSLATLRRLCRGRLRMVGADGFQPIPDEPGSYEEARPDGPAYRWITVAAPTSRAQWRETLDNAADQRCHGVLVPAGARLLDILRNPNDEGERRDLFLSVG
jgi:hypothetical protein